MAKGHGANCPCAWCGREEDDFTYATADVLDESRRIVAEQRAKLVDDYGEDAPGEVLRMACQELCIDSGEDDFDRATVLSEIADLLTAP